MTGSSTRLTSFKIPVETVTPPHWGNYLFLNSWCPHTGEIFYPGGHSARIIILLCSCKVYHNRLRQNFCKHTIEFVKSRGSINCSTQLGSSVCTCYHFFRLTVGKNLKSFWVTLDFTFINKLCVHRSRANRGGGDAFWLQLIGNAPVERGHKCLCGAVNSHSRIGAEWGNGRYIYYLTSAAHIWDNKVGYGGQRPEI